MPSKSKQAEANWQRSVLAAAAVVCLAGGALLSSTNVLEIGSKEFAAGTLLKVGFVLGITWVAAPQLEKLGWERVRGTLLLGVIIVIILLAIRPRIGAIAAAILVGGSSLFAVIGWFRGLTKPPR